MNNDDEDGMVYRLALPCLTMPYYALLALGLASCSALRLLRRGRILDGMEWRRRCARACVGLTVWLAG